MTFPSEVDFVRHATSQGWLGYFNVVCKMREKLYSTRIFQKTMNLKVSFVLLNDVFVVFGKIITQ